MEGKIKELVLVSCCDTIRSVYDILLESGKLDFLYILDVLHCDSACSRERMAVQLKGLAKAYAQYKGTEFDAGKFRAAFMYRKNHKASYCSTWCQNGAGII